MNHALVKVFFWFSYSRSATDVKKGYPVNVDVVTSYLKNLHHLGVGSTSFGCQFNHQVFF